jgi:negative regulator of genetic competence, sporulation and motility
MTFKKINDNKLIISFHSIELPEFMDLDNLVSNTDELKQIFINLLDEAKEKVGFNADDYTINVDTKVTLNNDIIIEVTKLVKTKKHKIIKTKNKFEENKRLKEFEKLNINANTKTNVKSNAKANTNTKTNAKINAKTDTNVKANTKTNTNTNVNSNAKANANKKINPNNANVELNEKAKANVKVRPKLISKPCKIIYSVYKFTDFDDFINFCAFMKSSNKRINIKKISSECLLFKYSSNYYLTLKNINESYSKIGLFYTGITEFSKFCFNSDSLFPVLNEYGTLFIPNNALANTIKSFCC